MSKDLPIIIAPSVLAADLAEFRADVQRAVDGGADWLHVDIMDGHFVPNISFGANIVRTLRKAFQKSTLDVHLMITQPDRYVDMFVDSGADILTVHVEKKAEHNISKTLSAIREKKCRAGLSINPPTPVEEILPYLKEVDLVLAMTVNPGFGGQAFIPDVLQKIEIIRDYREKNGLSFDIEVDGGINNQTVLQAQSVGANAFVAGTFLFKQADMTAAISKMREVLL